MKLVKALSLLRKELEEPMPPPREAHQQPTKRKKAMAKKLQKKSKKKVSKKGKNTAAENGSDEGHVTIQQLAEEAEIGEQTARVKLRELDEDLRDEGKRWRWKPNSKNLKKARAALGI